jgi:hypothetical protein
MSRDDPDRPPFYLIVSDYDRSVFAVEGPMSDDRPWQSAAREARSRQRKVACGPTGPDRDELAAEFAVNTGSPASRPAASGRRHERSTARPRRSRSPILC